ncbi:MAG TPA: SIMPL domain-containing protein [Granulicella sp.]
MKTTSPAAVLFALAAPILCATAPAQTIQVSKDNRSIAITATDKVTQKADIATVRIGFIAYGPTKDAAYATGSETSNAIHKALLSAGVAEDSIESENQNIAPTQPYELDKLPPAEKQQRQFQVTQSWTVRVAAADGARVLDVAVKNGANQGGSIDWSLKDRNAAEAEAAAKALQRARDVGQRMASGLSVTLGPLLYASNQTTSEPIRPINGRVFAMAAAPAAKVAPLALDPQQIETSSTVYAVFSIQ